tara:strand:- start:452 stop:706 length:255 start_codon:yes stop_codon:yes gene_type:complete
MENKITEEELKTIKDQQERTAKLLGEIGYLETQKHALLHNIADINVETNDFKHGLEEKYGKVEINLEDGSYSPLKEESEVLQNA